jgi:hypothetical protein
MGELKATVKAPEEISSIEWDLINKYTKSGGGTSKQMWMSEQKQVSNIISKMPDNKETVFWWYTMSNEMLSDLNGWEFTTKRLLSTTSERNVAQWFLDYAQWWNKVFLKIEWWGKDISKYSSFNDVIWWEKEVLFPIWTKFKVKEQIWYDTFVLEPIEVTSKWLKPKK